MTLIHFPRLIVCFAACLGIAQFVVAVAIAIRHYPGETDGAADGYSMAGNFLSDLGRSRTSSGRDNSVSAAFFNNSVIVLGITLLPFFAVLPTTLPDLRKVVWVSGSLAAIGLIGIGLTPYDLYFVAHNVCLGLWLGPMLILLVGYLVASFGSGRAGWVLGACTLGLVYAILAYASAASHGGQVVMQKVTVVVSFVWFAMIAANVAFTTVQVVTTSRRRQIIEWEAEEYMKALHRGLRKTTRGDARRDVRAP
jgi:hypothetical membrane protein